MSSDILKNNKFETELLAPAGSLEAARAAVNAGADAIYMGGPLFSARAFAKSSSEDMLSEAIRFCHLHGVRVFMTLNTIIKPGEFDELGGYLEPYAGKRLDGVIVQDIGVMKFIRDTFPELKLHISTQAAVTGARYARLLKDMGADRIVLARELSLKEIRNIKDGTGAELEVFAHGALCYAYSGQCLMSSFIGGRSGNRGRCAGTCRLPFEVLEAGGNDRYADKPGDCRQLNKKEDHWFSNRDNNSPDNKSNRDHKNYRCNKNNRYNKNRNDDADRYILSMKDLNTVKRLSEMIDAGVYSFKIEGRMKSPEYVAAVTGVYRKYLDLANGSLSGKTVLKEEYAADGNDDSSGRRSYTTGCGYRIDRADEELLSEVFDRGGCTDGYLDGKNGRDMIAVKEKPALRIHDEEAMADIRKRYIHRDKKLSLSVKAVIRKDEPAELKLSAAGFSVSLCSEKVVVQAQNRAVAAGEIADRLKKLGGTEFEISSIDIDIEDGCFLPMGEFNELRRNAVRELEDKILSGY